MDQRRTFTLGENDQILDSRVSIFLFLSLTDSPDQAGFMVTAILPLDLLYYHLESLSEHFYGDCEEMSD